MGGIKVGVAGFGQRGMGMIELLAGFAAAGDIEITGVCDLYIDRAQAGADICERETGRRPLVTADYNRLLDAGIEAIFIFTWWESHIEIAAAAMRRGITPGMEVGGAYSLEDCYALVRVSEDTGVPCMLLENCCYGERELMALGMARRGLFGEIVHCAGGYRHDLRGEIIHAGLDKHHYRLRNYIGRNCENYPTHEIGPIAKILRINDGNRFVSLTSMASCARGLHDYAKRELGDGHALANTAFKQGDIVNTLIKCANGETVSITLDTTLPRYYSRGFEVRGTRGGYFEDNDSVFMDGGEDAEFDFDWKPRWGNAKEYAAEYMHPLWASGEATGGHGGMDGFVVAAFIESLKTGEPFPIDVYDAATYMAITALSEQSIAAGSAPVAFPDFTHGAWLERGDICTGKYSLR